MNNKTLFSAGMAAGPLLMGLAWLQAMTREGFNLVRHPMSSLSLGDLGWIQIANFILAGCLIIGAAVGLKRLMEGPGSTWAPRMLFL